MTTTTVSINRPFPGENPDDIELTIERLAKYTLQAQGATHHHPKYPGKLFIFGNFMEFSGGFVFATDDVTVIDRLIAAFKGNPGYCPSRYTEG